NSRHAFGGASAVAHREVSGRSDGQRSRDDRVSRWTQIYLSHEQGLSPLVADNCHGEDRKSTRLNSSHVSISYAVFCLKKQNRNRLQPRLRSGGALPSTRQSVSSLSGTATG